MSEGRIAQAITRLTDRIIDTLTILDRRPLERTAWRNESEMVHYLCCSSGFWMGLQTMTGFPEPVIFYENANPRWSIVEVERFLQRSAEDARRAALNNPYGDNPW